ncbi:MAG TPA: hypothetical protein VK886_18690 [Vicinamibacterales bacterium]|nr:hypothetical protein [Vicinamibacterales bacterium]
MLALLTIPSAEHRRVFAPPARAADFSFLTSAQPIDQIARFFRERSGPTHPDSWRVARAVSTTLFDGASLYDRARLARLYGGLAPRVARGPMFRNGRVTHVVLLVSPYPDAELRRLNPGTLVMIVRVGE